MYAVDRSELPLERPARYNDAPTQDVAVCRLDNEGRRAITRLPQSRLPFAAKAPVIGARMIRARAQTVHGKPAFRAAIQARRCLVPGNGWLEWRGARGPRQSRLIGLAVGCSLLDAAPWEGCNQADQSLETFTIGMTEACDGLREIHHRRTAVIPPKRSGQWPNPARVSKRLLEPRRVPGDGPF